MKLRKKFSMAGAVSFFLFIASVILMMTSKRSDTVGLFRLFAAIFLIASVVLSLTGLIIKKLHRRKRRKRRHRTHSREGRAEMAPYTDEKPLEKPTEEPEEMQEKDVEDEHVYRIYTMVPKTPKSKKRRKKKDFLPESGEEAEKDGE